MQSLIDTLTCFNNYLVHGKKTSISDRISYYNGKRVDFNRDFHKTLINSNDELHKLVDTLLCTLKIEERQRSRYLGMHLTVYELLVELRDHNRNNDKLKAFIDIIDDHDRIKWAKIFFGSLIAVGIIEVSLPILTHLAGLSTIQELIAAAIFAPVLGSIITTAVAIFSLYQTLNNKSLSLSHQFQENFFILAHVALKFTAFGLLLTAVTTTSPVVATLFVVAEGINVLREIASLVHVFIQDRQRVVTPGSHDLRTLQTEARHQFDFVKRRNKVLIDIAAAVVCAGIVAAWCFVPGGLFVALGAGIGLGLVFFAKSLAHHRVEKAIKTQLYHQFEEVEHDDETKHASLQKSEELVLCDELHPEEAVVMKPANVCDDILRPSLKNPTDDRVSRLGMFSVGTQTSPSDEDRSVSTFGLYGS